MEPKNRDSQEGSEWQGRTAWLLARRLGMTNCVLSIRFSILVTLTGKGEHETNPPLCLSK
jgi:hypothetical protein